MVVVCPCSSGRSYAECCEPFHQGQASPRPVELVRSRYSAYALGLPDYIIRTTHPASPQFSSNTSEWQREIAEFSRDSSFRKLDILDVKENEGLARVTFTAVIFQGDRDVTFTEKSYFEVVGGRWLYRGGQLSSGHCPNVVTTGQLRLLPLAYYGDPVLRRKADPVIAITPDIHKLVEEMIETMDACDGIGLAAPQVHHSIQLFVMRVPVEKDGDILEVGEVKVIINPKLSAPSQATWAASEGCLSIPTIRCRVERPKEITLEYTALDGSSVRETVSGWHARVVFHEYDHLQGVLFIDRLSKRVRKGLEPELQHLQKRIHDGRAL